MVISYTSHVGKFNGKEMYFSLIFIWILMSDNNLQVLRCFLWWSNIDHPIRYTLTSSLIVVHFYLNYDVENKTFPAYHSPGTFVYIIYPTGPGVFPMTQLYRPFPKFTLSEGFELLFYLVYYHTPPEIQIECNIFFYFTSK